VVFLHKDSDTSVHTHAKSRTKRPRGKRIGFDSATHEVFLCPCEIINDDACIGAFLPCERGMQTNHIGLSLPAQSLMCWRTPSPLSLRNGSVFECREGETATTPSPGRRRIESFVLSSKALFSLPPSISLCDHLWISESLARQGIAGFWRSWPQSGQKPRRETCVSLPGGLPSASPLGSARRNRKSQ
jgi:hypothetical protein